MRSIKIGVLALYCLLFTLFALKDIDFDKKWDFIDYANSAVGFCTLMLSMVLIIICALTPTKIKDISVKLNRETIETLVKAFKEQEDETP